MNPFIQSGKGVKIDLVPFPHGVDRHGCCLLVNNIYHPQSHRAELDLERIFHPTDPVRFHPRLLQALREFLLELFPSQAVQLAPFLEGRFFEGKI